MRHRPSLTPLAESLPSTVPFVGPEALERARGGRPFAARIGANESVFGPSPKAVQAMREAAAESWKYGDPENFDLKSALARKHGVEPANIVVGEGVDGLLGLAARLFVEPGTPVVVSVGGYPTFNFHVAGFGGRLVAVPYREDREDVVALVDAARRERARLVYLANPDNPMGTWWTADEIRQAVDALPGNCLLLLDEAYAEFAPSEAILPLDMSDPRVIRFRTFSKAYGLAGMRVGYCLAEAGLARAFDKVRNHFGVGRVAQAGALAALSDAAHLAHVIARVDASRRRIGEIAAERGLVALPSATNFVAIDCGRDGAFARAVLDGLLARDIFVRMPGVAPLNRCIRVTAGTPEQLDLFAAALEGALEDARA